MLCLELPIQPLTGCQDICVQLRAALYQAQQQRHSCGHICMSTPCKPIRVHAHGACLAALNQPGRHLLHVMSLVSAHESCSVVLGGSRLLLLFYKYVVQPETHALLDRVTHALTRVAPRSIAT